MPSANQKNPNAAANTQLSTVKVYRRLWRGLVVVDVLGCEPEPAPIDLRQGVRYRVGDTHAVLDEHGWVCDFDVENDSDALHQGSLRRL